MAAPTGHGLAEDKGACYPAGLGFRIDQDYNFAAAAARAWPG